MRYRHFTNPKTDTEFLIWILTGAIAMMITLGISTWAAAATSNAQQPVPSKIPSKIPPIDTAGIDKLFEDRQHPLILAVMAAWCRPCIAELPVLEKLYQSFSSNGLRIVGISVDFDHSQAMLPFLQKHRITFPVYWGGEPAIQKLNIRKIPLLLFVRDGEVVKKLIGKQPDQTIEHYTRKITE